MVLTIHHLQISQSERIIWLCEELNIPYELKIYKRDPLASPSELKAISPLGTAPLITDVNNQGLEFKLGESAAIVEYIISTYNGTQLSVNPDQPEYTDYLYWLHVVSTIQTTIIVAARYSWTTLPQDDPYIKSANAKLKLVLQNTNTRLEKTKAYLAGSEFTAADLMCLFSFSTMRRFYTISLAEYPSIVSWLSRCGNREAYKRAMAKGDPDMDVAENLSVEGPPLVEVLRS